MSKYMSDDLALELLAESIFSGITKKGKDEDTDEDEETDTKKKSSDDDSEDDDETEEKDTDSDEDDEDEEKHEKSESDEEKDEDDKSEKSSAKEKSPAKSKLKALQTQYNDLLIDLFDKFSVECIEAALEDSESSFGENIETILDAALTGLKTKIMEELGVESGAGIAADGGIDELVMGDDGEESESDDESKELEDDSEEDEEGSEELDSFVARRDMCSGIRIW